MSHPLLAGLDLGGSKLLAVVVSPADPTRILARVQLTTTPGPDGVSATAARAVAELEAVVGTGRISGIGIGSPGLVDADAGTVAHAVNLGIDGVGLPLAAHLGRRLERPVVVENDVNAAAFGAARVLGTDDVAYLGIGTGIAAGLVLDGVLRRGRRNAAGEIGHLPLDPSGPLCNCGQRGCFETLASGSALAAQWPGAGRSGRALFASAADGNARAVVVRDRFAGHLAAGVRVLALTVDVDRIVIGGGVAEVGEPLRQAVVEQLAHQAEGSAFLTGLDLADRIAVLPPHEPVAAVGAALLAHARRPWPSTV
jgi:glucokinase